LMHRVSRRRVQRLRGVAGQEECWEEAKDGLRESPRIKLKGCWTENRHAEKESIEMRT
jgi:hypothetical protein